MLSKVKMQTIDIEILNEAKRKTTNLKSKATRSFNKKEFPIDILFECPFCHYISKNGNGTAKIFSKTDTFFCFACREWRFLENE